MKRKETAENVLNKLKKLKLCFGQILDCCREEKRQSY